MAQASVELRYGSPCIWITTNQCIAMQINVRVQLSHGRWIDAKPLPGQLSLLEGAAFPIRGRPGTHGPPEGRVDHRHHVSGRSAGPGALYRRPDRPALRPPGSTRRTDRPPAGVLRLLRQGPRA